MIFFLFSLIHFFLLQISSLILIVLPAVKVRHSSENIPQGLQENLGLLMFKPCSCFPMAHGVIRKTPGSSPGPYGIWKEGKLPLFKQTASLKSTLIEKHFRRDSMGEASSSSQSLLARLTVAQPGRRNALFPVDESERCRPTTHHVIWGS